MGSESIIIKQELPLLSQFQIVISTRDVGNDPYMEHFIELLMQGHYSTWQLSKKLNSTFFFKLDRFWTTSLFLFCTEDGLAVRNKSCLNSIIFFFQFCGTLPSDPLK